MLLRFALHRRSGGVLHFEPIGRAAGTVGGILALRDNAFEAFSNVVLSRSMNHNGVEFLILARPGRDQWTVVISYPRSTNSTKVPFEGSRDDAIAVARARIDGWLKRQPPSLTPRWPDVTGR